MSDSPTPSRRETAILVLLAVASCGVGILLASRSGDAILSAFVIERVARPLGLAGAYFLAALGLGRFLAPLWRGARCPAPIQLAAGLAVLLTLGHLLGQLSLLAGSVGFALSAGTILVGTTVAAFDLARAWRARKGATSRPRSPAPSRPSLGKILLSAGIGLSAAIALVAIAQPPGALWDSEFGGFDSLSYHLQLPQEWIARGRIEPVTHNVYSFLPGYVEAAFVFLGALSRAPAAAEPGLPAGLLAGDGWRTIACAALHAAFAASAGWILAGAATRLARRDDEPTAEEPGTLRLLGVALVVLTPWAMVVGTLAYNEMAMLALAAGALLVAAEVDIPAWRRGTLAGALVGVACGCKPTALLFCGVPVGLVLLTTTPARRWAVTMGPGLIAGALTLLPWLIRNFLACGNPIFPAATGTFGLAHWTAEQAARFTHEHQFHGPLLDRLRLLVLPDATDPAGPRHRGLLHPQWSVFFPLLALAAPHALFWFRDMRHRLAAALVAGLLAQVALWLFTTHLQSRFLLPLMLTGVPLIVLAFTSTASLVPPPMGEFWTRVRPLSHRAMRGMVFVAVAILAVSMWDTYASQRGGKPNTLLPFDPADMTATPLPSLGPEDRRAMVESLPQVGVAELMREARGTRVQLLGEAAAFYYPPGVRAHTTWDAWPLVDAGGTLELADPSTPYVLVDLASIERYEKSGYAPPEITRARVDDWLRRRTILEQPWPQAGKFLVRVRPSDGPTRE